LSQNNFLNYCQKSPCFTKTLVVDEQLEALPQTTLISEKYMIFKCAKMPQVKYIGLPLLKKEWRTPFLSGYTLVSATPSGMVCSSHDLITCLHKVYEIGKYERYGNRQYS